MTRASPGATASETGTDGRRDPGSLRSALEGLDLHDPLRRQAAEERALAGSGRQRPRRLLPLLFPLPDHGLRVHAPEEGGSDRERERSRRPAPANPPKPKADAEESDDTPLTSLTRKQLVKAARELGITVKSSDNKDAVRQMIEDHNAALLEKAEKDAAAAEASKPSADGDDPSSDGDPQE